MAFWGVEVKPAKPFTLMATPNDSKRLHLSQATLGISNTATKASRIILQCNVGNKSPLFLCVLSPDKVDSCQLNIEFQEAEDVIFSVIGPRSVHLTGYFLGRSSSSAGLILNDDESESFGEDIVDTDVEKGSSDDYDYSDSFINDDDPSAHTDDDDELSVKEKVGKTKAKKRNKRLRKKFQVSDSDSSDETSPRADDDEDSVEILNDHKTPKVLSSEVPLPSRVTRSKAKSSTSENGEKTSEATTHTHKTVEKKEEKASGDVEPSPVKKGSEVLSKKEKKKKKDKRNKESVVINTDEEEEKDVPETQKPETDKAIESSKKKRKKDRRDEETTERKKQAIEKKTKKEASNKKLPESELSPNEVTVEEIAKGKSDGKVAVQGKKVSILYTGKLKDTGKVFESNLEDSPLRFRLGGEKVIKGLSNGVEGMRVGDKRRIIIPPSLGYPDEGLNKEDVPKNSWLVYEVEAVKV
ncbi:unnamed protein product [Eruca vesicaria subsp. sativa]|uniref:peptidylprolyl isomerase n=1 Tax=Eruca vesicaria subsp. sativa TaxID=29727 RepID=A0ABC8LN16_ERUVS|nr:unnamed protein product [Eruca vesicaria subsp. sativa]